MLVATEEYKTNSLKFPEFKKLVKMLKEIGYTKNSK